MRYLYIVLTGAVLILYCNIDTLHPYYYDCTYVKITVYQNDPHLGLQLWEKVTKKGTEKYVIEGLRNGKYLYKGGGTTIAKECIKTIKPECIGETDEPKLGCEPDSNTRIINEDI